MRCQGHLHVGGPEGGEVLVECDLEVHPESETHGGWARVSWTKGHTHDAPAPPPLKLPAPYTEHTPLPDES